ncbi:MAG: PDZ domain-containing protein [Coleofasciculus sp. C1-SOL-03]|uniref:PDZ domain-containing protein n=1 Tax=Coleofasciculus sp. C1-SOL-03 TaxID=3069522 RepID=UPI003303D031
MRSPSQSFEPEATGKANSRSLDDGILIVRVVPNSPADEAGLQAGDVIQEIDNQSVTEAETVQQLVEANGVDNPLLLEVQRNGETLELTVRPEPLPPGDE